MRDLSADKKSTPASDRMKEVKSHTENRLQITKVAELTVL